MDDKKIMSPGIKGLLIALVLIVLSAALIVLDQFQNQIWGLVSTALFIGGIIWACVSFSKQMDGNVTFGNLFSHGFKATAAIAALSAAWLLLATSVLFPSMMDKMLEVQRTAMEEKGMSDSDIDGALKTAAKFTKPMMIIASVFINLLVGAIASLIGAAIAKKNPNTSMPQ